jgi:RimJ/RimL family protein N-acetyltransferase
MCALDLRPAIRTERLILRAPALADAPAVAELCNDLGVSGMVASMPHPYTLADAEAFLACAARPDLRTGHGFAIEHRQFGLIGMLSFKDVEPRRAEVGYWLGRPFWNRGYATEALTAALRWVKFDWRRNVVWAGHFADNKASGQVLCKAGFLYTGDVEHRMSVARAEPVATRMMVWLA